MRRRESRNVDNAVYICDVPSPNNKLHITSCYTVPQMSGANENAVFSQRNLYVGVCDFETHFFQSESAIFFHVCGLKLNCTCVYTQNYNYTTAVRQIILLHFVECEVPRGLFRPCNTLNFAGSIPDGVTVIFH